MTKEELGKRLRTWRQLRSISIVVISDMLGCSIRRVSLIERGEIRLPANELDEFCAAYRITPEKLING